MLSNELLEKIKTLSQSGLSQCRIAKDLNLTTSIVRYYLSEKYLKSLERKKEKEDAFRRMEEQVKEILPKCNSINHICSCLGLRGLKHYYNIIENIIAKNNLDTSHFGNLRHKVVTRVKSNDEYFSIGKRNNETTLKRLIKGYKEYKCESCGISEWNNKPIRLQVHHINGNNEDNTLENLQILCPNCHSQTDTYSRGDHKENIIRTNIDYSKVENYVPVTETMKICEFCGKEYKPTKKNRKYCSHKCSHNATRLCDPTKEELIQKFKEIGSFSGISREYNVSDNAVRKWFKRFNLPVHTKEMNEFIKKYD